MAGRHIPWLVSLCLIMCIYLSLSGKSIEVSTETKAIDDKTVFFATQAVTVRIIENGVISPRETRRHISKQIVAYFTCKLIQRSCLALTLIALSGDIELNPGYRTLKSTKDFRGLKIAHLNVRSIRNKIDQIQFELLQGQFFDILTISESWLNDTIDDAEVQIPGFSCVRKDREESEKGGGNIVYIRDGLPFRIRHDLNNNDNECLWFEIVRRKCKPILICSVYKAPEAYLESFISSLEDSLLKLDYCNSDLVLLGDFNVDFTPCKGKSNTAKQKLLNFSRTL